MRSRSCPICSRSWPNCSPSSRPGRRRSSPWASIRRPRELEDSAGARQLAADGWLLEQVDEDLGRGPRRGRGEDRRRPARRRPGRPGAAVRPAACAGRGRAAGAACPAGRGYTAAAAPGPPRRPPATEIGRPEPKSADSAPRFAACGQSWVADDPQHPGRPAARYGAVSRPGAPEQSERQGSSRPDRQGRRPRTATPEGSRPAQGHGRGGLGGIGRHRRSAMAKTTRRRTRRTRRWKQEERDW